MYRNSNWLILFKVCDRNVRARKKINKRDSVYTSCKLIIIFAIIKHYHRDYRLAAAKRRYRWYGTFLISCTFFSLELTICKWTLLLVSSGVSFTQYRGTYSNCGTQSEREKSPLHLNTFDHIRVISHLRNCLTLFSTYTQTREGRAVRGELQLLVHCYMRSRVTCAQQVFCKMHRARAHAAKLENSYIPDDINLSSRAICVTL